MKSHSFFIRNTLLLSFTTIVLILPDVRGKNSPDVKSDLTAGKDQDRGIGFKIKPICENCPTTDNPYPFPPSAPEFTPKIGPDMVTDEQFDNDYYKEYDFEFAKSAYESPNFERLVKEHRQKSYETNSLEEMEAEAEFPDLWRKMYCSADSPYDFEVLCNTIDSLVKGENIENEEHREQVLKNKRWY